MHTSVSSGDLATATRATSSALSQPPTGGGGSSGPLLTMAFNSRAALSVSSHSPHSSDSPPDHLEAALLRPNAASAATAAASPAQSAAAAPAFAGLSEEAQFEADKRTIYKHPLFPLLALLFEKCEVATQSIECPSSDSFNTDVQIFVQQQQREKKPFLSDNAEANELMIKSIQVLRIHLLELEKVQELCKDFCNRYITCLKGKMQSENLLRSDYGGYDSDDSSGGGVGMASSSSRSSSVGGVSAAAAAAAAHYMQQQQQTHSISTPLPIGTSAAAMLTLCHSSSPLPSSASAAQLSASSAHATSFQFAFDQQTQQQLMLQQQIFPNQQIIHTQYSSGLTLGGHSEVNGSTPLSAIAANTCPLPPDANIEQIAASILSDSFDDDSGSEENKNSKSGGKTSGLPKQATAVMKAWLFQHLMHPYPTEEEKQEIGRQTNLSMLQVNNWFINARRRILQPMLDVNVDGSHKAKRSSASSRSPTKSSAERFWPENIQNFYPMHGFSSDADHDDLSNALGEGLSNSVTGEEDDEDNSD